MGFGSHEPKITDNGPVLRDLYALGFKRADPLPRRIVRDGFLITAPDGSKQRIKIQKRNGKERSPGKHTVGVAYQDFSNVDSFVLWVKGANHVLVMSTVLLADIFRECQFSNYIIKDRQWLVTIHFEGNRVFFEPNKSGVPYEVSEHALLLPNTKPPI